MVYIIVTLATQLPLPSHKSISHIYLFIFKKNVTAQKMKSLQNLWLTQPMCSWIWYSITPLISRTRMSGCWDTIGPVSAGTINSWSHMWQNAMKKLPNFLRHTMWRGAETSIGWFMIACWIWFCKALVNNKLIRDGASMVVRPLHTHHSNRSENGELSTASTCRVDSAHMVQDIDSYTWMELGQYDGSGH